MKAVFLHVSVWKFCSYVGVRTPFRRRCESSLLLRRCESYVCVKTPFILRRESPLPTSVWKLSSYVDVKAFFLRRCESSLPAQAWKVSSGVDMKAFFLRRCESSLSYVIVKDFSSLVCVKVTPKFGVKVSPDVSVKTARTTRFLPPVTSAPCASRLLLLQWKTSVLIMLCRHRQAWVLSTMCLNDKNV